MNRNSPEISRRVFLARVGAALASPFLAGCDLVLSPEDWPPDVEKQKIDARKIAEDLVANKYQLREAIAEVRDRAANEVYAFVLFSTQGADNPLVLGVTSSYKAGHGLNTK